MIYCVACGSTNVVLVSVRNNKFRPNGQNFEVFKCRDCGQKWEE